MMDGLRKLLTVTFLDIIITHLRVSLSSFGDASSSDEIKEKCLIQKEKAAKRESRVRITGVVEKGPVRFQPSSLASA